MFWQLFIINFPLTPMYTILTRRPYPAPSYSFMLPYLPVDQLYVHICVILILKIIWNLIKEDYFYTVLV